jgi:transcriptional regulator with XRE-family HTH domain
MMEAMEPTDNPLSQEIRRAIQKSGLTLSEIARRMGTTESAVSRMASPRYRGHTVGSLERLAEALGARLEVRFAPKE